MFEKLARLLASWHGKLKHCHTILHVGTFIGTLPRKDEKLARFWHVDDHTGKHGTQFSKLTQKI